MRDLSYVEHQEEKLKALDENQPCRQSSRSLHALGTDPPNGRIH